MSKRIDKKKQKKLNVSSPVSEASEKDIDIFIQYQNHEYLEADILNKIKEKCRANGLDITSEEKLSVYIKPEDQKAYFTFSTLHDFVEL